MNPSSTLHSIHLPPHTSTLYTLYTLYHPLHPTFTPRQVLDCPAEAKYRTINTSAAAFKARLQPVYGWQSLLGALAFARTAEGKMELPEARLDPALLRLCLELIHAALPPVPEPAAASLSSSSSSSSTSVSSFSSSAAAYLPPQGKSAYPESFAQLQSVGMGWGEAEISAALLATSGNADRAYDILYNKHK